MEKIKKESSLKKYLGDKEFKKIILLHSLVENTNKTFDDEAYNDMLRIMIKYVEGTSDAFYIYIIVREMLKKYCDLSYRLISKISRTNNAEIYKMYEFVNLYTESSIDFKIFVAQAFLKSGIINERSRDNFPDYSFYKKLLQILSVKYRDADSKPAQELYENSKVKRIQEKAKRIVNTVIKLNDIAALVNQDNFMKTTNTTLKVCTSLPDVIVDNEEDFKNLMEYLYKMFWETKARGYALNKELDFINNIRNYFDHDLEHGKNSDIRAKFRFVGEFYKSAIGKKVPENAKDWQGVQEKVYDLLISFLDNVVIEEKVAT